MRIFVNNKEAVLKKGTSFEYVAENRLFTGSDSYTLSITFPMRDCFVNQQIFGFLNRMDVPKVSVSFECEISDGSFQKVGVLVITQVSDVEIKGQFLEGRSEQNYNMSLDEIFINELDLGYPPSVAKSSMNVQEAMRYYPHVKWVALPWVNNSSGILHNAMAAEVIAARRWEDTTDLSFQPYLLYILEKVCEAIGYSCDFSSLRKSKFCYLLIVNCLPPTWGYRNFSAAMPRWSVAQLFEEVELLTDGEFVVNHKTKSVRFRFNADYVASLPEVVLESVVDSYTADVSQEEQSQYIGRKNLAFADNGDPLWPLMSCRWFIDAKRSEAKVFATFSELSAWAQGYLTSGVEQTVGHTGAVGTSYYRGYKRGSEGNKLLYCTELDTYFVMYNYAVELVKTMTNSFGGTMNFYRYFYRLMPVNQFGMRFASKDAEDVTLNIVPFRKDYTDDEHGYCIFLECGEMNDAVLTVDANGNTSSSSSGTNVVGNMSNPLGGTTSSSGSSVGESEDGRYQPEAVRGILSGEVVKSEAYFDKLYVGYWSSRDYPTSTWMPVPSVDTVAIERQTSLVQRPYSLRIDGSGADGMLSAAEGEDRTEIGALSYIKEIDGLKKHNFSFLAETIPEPMSVFCIRGIRYLCEKITATFTENGMSQLMKGVFYRIM